MKTLFERIGRSGRCIAAGLLLAASGAQAQLTLEQAVALAQGDDPWLAGSEQRELALQAESSAAGSLPDPMLNAGFANLPTDTFDFNQEAMTQFVVGVSQVLPRGDSRELRRQQLQQLGAQQPHARAERRAQVAVSVSELWLDSWLARESIRLIEEDRELFQQLVDVAESRYASALGGSSQNDLIRAQLELTRLDDRLARLREGGESARSRLRQWLPAGSSASGDALSPAAALPQLVARPLPGLVQGAQPGAQSVAAALQQHPALRAIDQRLAAAQTGVELAEQSYRPEWRFNASYGYRDDAPGGLERADFFSVGVAVDLPLFTAGRHDQQVRAASAGSEALRTERALALRRMVGEYLAQWSRLQRLEERRALYRERLLKEMNDQSQAALAAYTHDTGDFAEVVRARIDELNARIDALELDVERLKTIARLDYYLQAADAGEEMPL